MVLKTSKTLILAISASCLNHMRFVVTGPWWGAVGQCGGHAELRGRTAVFRLTLHTESFSYIEVGTAQWRWHVCFLAFPLSAVFSFKDDTRGDTCPSLKSCFHWTPLALQMEPEGKSTNMLHFCEHFSFSFTNTHKDFFLITYGNLHQFPRDLP